MISLTILAFRFLKTKVTKKKPLAGLPEFIKCPCGVMDIHKSALRTNNPKCPHCRVNIKRK